MSMTQIDRIIKTAVNEIGYLEKATNSQLYDKYANAGAENWTKYANDFDTKEGWTNWFNGEKNGHDWCTVFHDWCYVKTFGFDKAVTMLFNQDPQTSLRAGCMHIPKLYRRNGRWGSTPKVGAQFIQGEDHTGIVIAVRDGYVYTIEGNKGDSVMAVKHTLDYFSGFGYPLFDSEAHGIWHMVESSDTLNSIAAKYGVSAAWIAAENGISNPNNIKAGQVFYIPTSEVTDPEEPEEPDNPLSGTKYIVQEGDTLNSIAARFNTTAAAIAAHNGIDNINLIYVGQTLYIPENTTPTYTEYTVKSGDSLGRIAVSYGLTVAAVASYNSISSPYTIYAGQKLRIPTAGRKNWVKEFQLAIIASGISSLPLGGADGEWGAETESAAARATVERGVENPMAQFAQQMLLAYGYSLPRFGADGEFWEESVTATIQYQQDHGLVADGVIGVVTWKDMLQVG